MKSRVFIVGTIFPPDTGGPATFVDEFSKWLIEKNYKVNILSTTKNKSLKIENSNLVLNLIERNTLPIRLIRFIITLRKEAIKSDSILAVGGFIETYIATRFLKRKVYYKVPGDIVWERARNSGRTQLSINEFQKTRLNARDKLIRYLHTKALCKATGVIVPSNGLKEICLNWGVSESRIFVVHNSVAPIFIRPEGKIEHHKYDVVTVCRLTKWKGVEQLILVCSKLELRLLVIGDGPEYETLRSLSNELRSDVTFTGQIESEAVPKYLLNSKIMVLNSSYEGLPHSLIEAREMGLICISRRDTGSEEVITHGVNGYLTDGTTNDLEEKITEALQENKRNLAIINNGLHDNTDRFNREKNFSSILEFII